MMSSGLAIAPIFFATCCRSSSASSGVPDDAFLHGHKRRHGLALDVVGAADDGRLGDLRVVDQRAFDLHRPDAMPGDVEHVVDPAEQPEEPVVVALGAIAR